MYNQQHYFDPTPMSVSYCPDLDTSVQDSRSCTHILLVDDHPAIREALASVIGMQDDMEVCGEARSAEEAISAIIQLQPDAAVIDVSLSDVHGIDFVQFIRSEYPSIKIVVFSIYDEDVYAGSALRAGASAYIVKSAPASSVIDALRAAVHDN